jgi:hypothetical protein
LVPHTKGRTWVEGVYDQGVIRVFAHEQEEAEGGWRRLNNEELYNLHASSNVISVIKSMRIRWAEHVVHTGEMRN